MDNTIYLSIDVEADGPIPGYNSMLSFGVAAFRLTEEDPRKPIATFERNLETLDTLGAWDQITRPSPDTMKWWATQGEAWDICRKDPVSPLAAMPDLVEWVRSLPGRTIVVGYPVTYDFMFLYWYTMAFGGLADGERCPYGFSGLDIKTMAAAKLDVPFKAAIKRRMPKRWFRGSPKHNHEAITDAIGQGITFVNMMLEEK